MKKIFAILMLLLNCPVLAWSADCVTVPTCAEMGYKLTAPKGDGWLCTACPTDPTKFACSEKPCPPNSSTNQAELNKVTTVDANYTFVYDVYCPVGYQGDKVCYRNTPIRIYVSCGGVESVAKPRARGACTGISAEKITYK